MTTFDFNEGESWDSFSEKERTVGDGITTVSCGSEAPWLSPFGACLVKVYGIRRNENGTVEFGVGNEQPPILAWVTAKDFYNEWPQ